MKNECTNLEECMKNACMMKMEKDEAMLLSRNRRINNSQHMAGRYIFKITYCTSKYGGM